MERLRHHQECKMIGMAAEPLWLQAIHRGRQHGVLHREVSNFFSFSILFYSFLFVFFPSPSI
jgi:hypothetical protein